jgi:hypothetical protein
MLHLDRHTASTYPTQVQVPPTLMPKIACAENKPLVSHCEGPQPRSNPCRMAEIASSGYRPPA